MFSPDGRSKKEQSVQRSNDCALIAQVFIRRKNFITKDRQQYFPRSIVAVLLPPHTEIISKEQAVFSRSRSKAANSYCLQPRCLIQATLLLNVANKYFNSSSKLRYFFCFKCMSFYTSKNHQWSEVFSDTTSRNCSGFRDVFIFFFKDVFIFYFKDVFLQRFFSSKNTDDYKQRNQLLILCHFLNTQFLQSTVS